MFEIFKKNWESLCVGSEICDSQFLHARNMQPRKIYRQINEVYGDVMDDSSVCLLYTSVLEENAE